MVFRIKVMNGNASLRRLDFKYCEMFTWQQMLCCTFIFATKTQTTIQLENNCKRSAMIPLMLSILSNATDLIYCLFEGSSHVNEIATRFKSHRFSVCCRGEITILKSQTTKGGITSITPIWRTRLGQYYFLASICTYMLTKIRLVLRDHGSVQILNGRPHPRH